jgi:transcription factor SPN1
MTTKVEPSIKRQAERLIGEWTRPIMKRSDDYRQREFVQADFDPSQAPIKATVGEQKAAKAAAARRAALAIPMTSNRARVEGGLGTYTIVPKSDLSRVQGVKRLGASGDDMFRRLKARQQARKQGR